MRPFRSLAVAAVVIAAAGILTACTSPGAETAAHTASAAPDPLPSAPHLTGAAAALPKHVLTGYWQDFQNNAEPLKLAQVPRAYDLVAVAFASADPAAPGAVTFAIDADLARAVGGYTDADFIADVATLHARGQHVILSVGGELGNVAVTDDASAAAFASSVEALMTKYGFDGVDIDLENGIDPVHLAKAITAIAAARSGAIITMAPQTVDMADAAPYLQLALAVRDVLTIVNTQYYNSGSMVGCGNGVYEAGTIDFATAQTCAQVRAGLAPQQLGIGFPAMHASADNGYLDPGKVDRALTCLTEGTGCGSYVPSTRYRGLRGAMTWSINWDASNDYAFARSVSKQLHALD